MKSLSISRTTRFISDTHFGHAKMLSACARPFDSVEEMDRGMIAAWNSVVRRDDHVWHLGDFGYKVKPDYLKRVFDQLNGIKHLIVGNHDHDQVATTEFGWASVDQIRVLNYEGQKVVLCHYPMREWPDFWHGAIHLFGHTHANIPSTHRSLDVGVDNVGFTPVSMEEIQQRLSLLPEIDFRGAPPIVLEEEEALPEP